MKNKLKNKKPWYKSKTIISAIVILILGIYNSLQPYLLEHYSIILPTVPEWIYSLLATLGIRYRITASTKIGKK